MAEVLIRPMWVGDLPAVHAIQCAAYPPSHHESVEVLMTHLQAGADTCFVAEHGAALRAYLFAHPWAGDPPSLHTALPPCEAPAHLFIHDLAVHPAAAGGGLASRLVAALQPVLGESGLNSMRLVAVGQAAGFWRRQGFHALPEVAAPVGYGEAQVMQALCELSQPYSRASSRGKAATLRNL